MCGCLDLKERSKHLDDAGERTVVFKGDKVLLRQAYCARGHPLIEDGNPTFEGARGIKLVAEAEGSSQVIYLSPFQRDPRKYFEHDYPLGTLVTLRCPECKEPFPEVAPHGCHTSARYIAIFMEDDANPETSICVCNAWNCHDSFTKLFDDVITELRQYVHIPLLG